MDLAIHHEPFIARIQLLSLVADGEAVRPFRLHEFQQSVLVDAGPVEDRRAAIEIVQKDGFRGKEALMRIQDIAGGYRTISFVMDDMCRSILELPILSPSV